RRAMAACRGAGIEWFSVGSNHGGAICTRVGFRSQASRQHTQHEVQQTAGEEDSFILTLAPSALRSVTHKFSGPFNGAGLRQIEWLPISRRLQSRMIPRDMYRYVVRNVAGHPSGTGARTVEPDNGSSGGGLPPRLSSCYGETNGPGMRLGG